MNIKIIHVILFLLLMFPVYASISVVYNLRIAETSKRHISESVLSKPILTTGTLFGTFRKKYNGTKHRCGGGLFTLVYARETYFLRVDAAAARVASESAGVHFARAQGDDLLFSGGYSPKISHRVSLTFSALLGIPTHKDTSLEFVQFGTGHYGLGGQIDGAFQYSQSRNNTIRCAARLIHFFPRTVYLPLAGTPEKFRFANGQLADIFFAFNKKIDRHTLEAGYNPSFFFNAYIRPVYDDAAQRSNYIRNNFYGTYRYRFFIGRVAQMITAALSYGFETRPKITGNKRIITTWASWSINF